VLKGFIVAGLITAHDYGVWGLLFISLGTLYWLKDIGVADKFVQQDETDQEVAFQKAFTMELLLTGVFVVVLAAAVPLLSVIYGTRQIIAPGLAICAILPALALQSPVWVYYRRMDYVRQRTLQAADPLVAFTVTVVLAAAGLGYWALVLGVAAGSWTGALVALRFNPYRLKLRYERATLRSYASFSWPLFLVNGSSVVIVQAAVFVGQKAIGLAGVGIITLASWISAYSDHLNGFAIGMAIVAGVHLAARWYYLRKLFSGFAMARHAARAIAPTVPAAGAVLLVRLAEPGRAPLAELALYAAVTVAATWLFERDLLREVLGYVRGPRGSAAHPIPESA